ncbi:sulfite exporter TauE/SafE family protein [Pollutimonas harenae]|uniref:Probable membrane transporter protein n=1 Tax=Pollutimonas harenae TaxID=657015 RepID=A0A853H2R0_9BURK|nr:sulfite exporter TauE/SafE family protein [Pollutimonas harenae]NYT86552.1 sulfite exporter TauE/SafE family protein [Pollutimonas harenae]TEA69706.1 sulfite exporter TauE/SafE family protein [Pollutimonas harenae]
MPLIEMFDDYTLWSFLLVTAVFVLAGLVKGIVGLGLPTISMALLSIFMIPAQAAALLVIPSLVTNVWQTRPFHTLAHMLRRIGGMQWGVAAGTLAGAVLLGAPAGAWAAVSLGVALIVYSAWALFGKPFTTPARIEKWLGPLVGILTGFITAATGVFVVPAVPYLQSLGLTRDELIQAMGVSFTVSTVALATGLWLNDSYSLGAVGTSLVMLVPALIGMGAGQRLRQSLAPAVFRRCFLVSLVIVGVYLALKGLL